ncbi:MAG TPA: class I SAM-dependent methyltransferase [Sandaracinaceae bacterium]
MKKRDEPLGARTFYRDARWYDHTNRRYRDDIDFYVRLARRAGGPVLELGVGTGRVALAMAEAGARVVGVDREPEMLARAAERLAKRSREVRRRVELREGDMRELRLGRRFPLVIAPFNAFQHLYEDDDVERALATCRRHLAPGGKLAFDVLMPDVRALSRDPSRFYKCRPVVHPRDGRRYAYAEAFAYDHARQIQTVTIRFTDLEDPEVVFFSRLTQRQFFPRELAALLRYNGFEILSLDGGFAGEPIDEDTQSLVVVARPRRN